jgi:tetratricopeptide (TPR) repeat protein
MFETAAQAWPTTPTETWLPPILAAAEDLRAALAWCFGPDGDPALGLRLVGASVTVWWELPNLPLRESRAWFDRAVEFIGSDTPDLVAARVWFGHAWRDMRQGDTANLPAAETAVELFANTADRAGHGAALWRAGSAANTRDGAARAEATLLAAEAVLRQVPPGKWLALCLIRLGDLRMRAGDTEAALAAYEEGMDLARQTRHWYGLTNGGSNSADLLFIIGRPDDALAQLQTLRAQLPLGPRTPLTSKLGSHLVAAGRIQEAMAALTEVLDQALSIGYVAAFARSLETLALLRAEAGDAVTAALLAGYARNAVPSNDRWGAPRVVLDRLEAAINQALPPATLARRLRQGAAWDEPTAHAAARAALSAQAATLNQN